MLAGFLQVLRTYGWQSIRPRCQLSGYTIWCDGIKLVQNRFTSND